MREMNHQENKGDESYDGCQMIWRQGRMKRQL